MPDPTPAGGYVLVSPSGMFWTGRRSAIGPINTADISKAARFPDEESAKRGEPIHILAIYKPKPASDYEEAASV